MRSFRKTIVWEAFISHKGILKVYCSLGHFKVSLGRKGLVSKYIKKYEDESFREDNDIPRKYLACPDQCGLVGRYIMLCTETSWV